MNSVKLEITKHNLLSVSWQYFFFISRNLQIVQPMQFMQISRNDTKPCILLEKCSVLHKCISFQFHAYVRKLEINYYFVKINLTGFD